MRIRRMLLAAAPKKWARPRQSIRSLLPAPPGDRDTVHVQVVLEVALEDRVGKKLTEHVAATTGVDADAKHHVAGRRPFGLRLHHGRRQERHREGDDGESCVSVLAPELARRIDTAVGGNSRAFTDSAPVLEKPIAAKATPPFCARPSGDRPCTCSSARVSAWRSSIFRPWTWASRARTSTSSPPSACPSSRSRPRSGTAPR